MKRLISSINLDSLVDRPWKRLFWFASAVALTYLPYALRLTYYRDDWYYAYDAMVGPSGIFRALFASDRPARGPFFEIYYTLYGMTPIAYHLTMYIWRLSGGLAVVSAQKDALPAAAEQGRRDQPGQVRAAHHDLEVVGVHGGQSLQPKPALMVDRSPPAVEIESRVRKTSHRLV